jgi:hypothetical protein
MLAYAIDLAAATILFAGGFLTVNRISWRTWKIAPVYCFGSIVFTVGAAAIAIGPLVGARMPDWPEAILHLGLALLIVANQRSWISALDER